MDSYPKSVAELIEEFEKTEKSTRKYCNQKCYANRPRKEKITFHSE